MSRNNKKNGTDRKIAAKTKQLTINSESILTSNDDFDIQLNWCLTNLKAILRGEVGDDGKKLTERKITEAGHVYNQLADSKTPFIKKRQLMANYFGDYRKQMAKESEKFKTKKEQLKITNCIQEKKQSEKSVVYKIKDRPSQSTSGELFKFNFPDP